MFEYDVFMQPMISSYATLMPKWITVSFDIVGLHQPTVDRSFAPDYRIHMIFDSQNRDPMKVVLKYHFGNKFLGGRQAFHFY